MSFASDVLKFKEKALLHANKSVCNTFESLASEVIDRSPNAPDHIGRYAKGTLKDNWYTSIGSPSSEVSSSANLSGISSLSRFKAILAQAPFLGKDNTLYFTNNTNYAARVEYLGWPQGEGSNGWVWAGAQPYHMVTMSVANLIGKP